MTNTEIELLAIGLVVLGLALVLVLPDWPIEPWAKRKRR